MAYEPTIWKTGDVVTSNKLNKIESGIASAGFLVVHLTNQENSELKIADKTWQEIFDAVSVVFVYDAETSEQYPTDRSIYQLDTIYQTGGSSGGSYAITFYGGNKQGELKTNSADGYPAEEASEGGGK